MAEQSESPLISRLSPLLDAYGLNADECSLGPLGNGLINHTWLLISPDEEYVLQKINTRVFTNPQAIDNNLKAMHQHISLYAPEYKLILPIATRSGETMPMYEGHYFRLMPFAHGAKSYDVVSTPEIAFEAAKAFADFARVFTHLPPEKMQTTLPDFHNLDLRYRQFTDAISHAIPERLAQAKALENWAKEKCFIVDEYRRLLMSDQFPKRIMHHDTKISNVLFNADNCNMGVIDLDTVMPGYFISDVGDMMRTYLPPVSEEEGDFANIAVREEIFSAIVAGYKGSMGDMLSGVEKELFYYAGLFMVYMQAIRFLTDYITGDTYYGCQYPDHNLVRAGNQFYLLQCIMEKQQLLKELAAKA